MKKYNYIGISLASTMATDIGIAVLDNSLNITRLDKSSTFSQLKKSLYNFPVSSTVICVDLPLNHEMLKGKWRIEAKRNQALKLDNLFNEQQWIERYSTLGSDFCTELMNAGYEVYRFNSGYVKSTIGYAAPCKLRSPMAGKYLQEVIKEKFKIQGFTNNNVALCCLDAIIGAYTAWSCSNAKNTRSIGDFNELSIMHCL